MCKLARRCILTRDGGHAIGGRILGRHHARQARRCECCHCPITAGDVVFQVLVARDVLEVCSDCAGGR
jgi:hypothetical protein